MIFIPGDIPSSKNSKRVAYAHGRVFVFNSKFVESYKRETSKYWGLNRTAFYSMVKGKEKPYKIEFQFVRRSQRRFDFVNLLQLPLDLMVKYEWIEDDDYKNILPIINEEIIFDKHNPGIKIKAV